MESYDVVVVGAGPTGSAAARAAASSGARVLLLDRAAFPRYKTCGGGLIGPSLEALAEIDVPARTTITAASFSLRGAKPARRTASGRLIRTVVRSELDAVLARAAVRAGAEFAESCAVRSVAPDGVVETDQGRLSGRVVIAADGASGRASRAVGVRLSQVDLGLEVELEAQGSGWPSEEIHLDWGPLPGSYAWVFPKGDTLTVGVIARKGDPGATRAYLRSYLAQRGLERQRVVHESGHLTRCRTPDSPLAAGRILAAGDAAGLLEPWTREGISFALRSGAQAGLVAAHAVEGEWSDARLALSYEMALGQELLPEMAAGALCLRAFERRPGAFHRLIARTDLGWRSFVRLASGETTLARAMAHRPARLAVRALSL